MRTVDQSLIEGSIARPQRERTQESSVVFAGDPMGRHSTVEHVEKLDRPWHWIIVVLEPLQIDKRFFRAEVKGLHKILSSNVKTVDWAGEMNSMGQSLSRRRIGKRLQTVKETFDEHGVIERCNGISSPTTSGKKDVP
jgi:hypothetical protein